MALDTTNTTLDSTSDVGNAVKSLYGFNLGFALEGRVNEHVLENVERIKIDIVDFLTSNRVKKERGNTENDRARIDTIRAEMESLVENTISKEVLSETAIKYSGYKSDVERLKGAKF